MTATYTRMAGETVAGSPYAITSTLSPAGVLASYNITYNTAPFAITPATPIVTWADPAAITYPTPLGATQLDATANVPGTFAYTPPTGTVLSPGNTQLLSVLFTPTDTSDYTTATAKVHINVLQTDASVVETSSTPVVNAGDTASYSLVVTGNGPGSSTNVVLTDTLPAGLNWTVSGPDATACSPASPVPGGTILTCGFGTLPPGATKHVTLTAATTVPSCGDITNTATVSSFGDANASNDSAGPVTITINCPAATAMRSSEPPSTSGVTSGGRTTRGAAA